MGIKVKQEAAMKEIEEEREDGEGREGGEEEMSEGDDDEQRWKLGKVKVDLGTTRAALRAGASRCGGWMDGMGWVGGLR